jgi:endonuclease/exonuclease/phosphatase family metal-dependent hydrolase
MRKKNLVLPMLAKAVAPAAALTLLVGLGAAATSPAVTARPAGTAAGAGSLATTASGTADIRVATFNISSMVLDSTHGPLRPWKERRGRVISEILSEHVDVIGVQEAAPGRSMPHHVVDGANQYLDLRNGLNKAGGHYALTAAAGFNCVNSLTAYHCKKMDRDASNADRILYNTQKLTMVGHNSMAYSHRTARNAHPFLTWARFRVRSNGHEFRFFDTHLDPRNRAVRKAQWQQMIKQINHLKQGRPVISVGDFNTQKFDPMAASMFPAMKRSGYGEVLNEQYRVNPNRHIRARARTHAWISSLNHMSRNVRAFSYDDATSKTGNSIDHIFASNSLAVRSYKVVLKYNPSTLTVSGVLPSDHNMVCATIAI